MIEEELKNKCAERAKIFQQAMKSCINIILLKEILFQSLMNMEKL